MQWLFCMDVCTTARWPAAPQLVQTKGKKGLGKSLSVWKGKVLRRALAGYRSSEENYGFPAQLCASSPAERADPTPLFFLRTQQGGFKKAALYYFNQHTFYCCFFSHFSVSLSTPSSQRKRECSAMARSSRHVYVRAPARRRTERPLIFGGEGTSKLDTNQSLAMTGKE